MVAAPGLIFTDADIHAAQLNRDSHLLTAAWTVFDHLQHDSDVAAIPICATAYHAFRWRLLRDADAGADAVQSLAELSYLAADPDTESFARAFAAAQAIACIHDHPVMTAPVRARILDAWQANSSVLQPGDAIHLRAWSALVGICAGILLDRSDTVEMSAAQFRALVDTIQPHGYVAALVGDKDGETLRRTLQFVQAMVLTAETGTQHGFDLWAYERRGVSVMTAALYPLYYYYYPERWPWDAPIDVEPVQPGRRARRERARQPLSDMTPETVQPLFRTYCSFLEIVNRRSPQPVRAVTLILDELRPIVAMLGGGPVTLTHARPAPRKRRGIFGRSL
jgi:hypothetical protein